MFTLLFAEAMSRSKMSRLNDGRRTASPRAWSTPVCFMQDAHDYFDNDDAGRC
jgi:hypothetical protein